MKVYIGPFKSWFGPYQLANLLQKVGVSDDHCHELGKWLTGKEDNKKGSWLLRFFQWIDSKRDRKIKIKIHDYDTWNMESTLALIILPMLKQLKAEAHGAPGNMPAFGQTSNQSRQETFEFYAKDDDYAWEMGHKQWMEIMDKMIWTFEQLQPDYDWEEQYRSGEHDIQWKKIEGSDFTTMVRGPNDTYKADYDAIAKHSERIDEGLKLFGQYFRNLWD